MSEARIPWVGAGALGLGVLAVAGFMTLGGGSPWLALVPPLLFLLAVAFLRLPVRVTATALLFVGLVVESTSESPMADRWVSPLLAPGDLLFENLNTSVGLHALHVSAFELLVAGLVVAWIVRRLRGEERPLPGGTRPLFVFVGLALAALVVLGLWGLARGGSFRQSLWQVRQLGWLAPLVMLFVAATPGDRARRTLLGAVVVAAVIRALLGLYFYYAIARPQGLEVPYITTHSDSVLFVVALLVALQGLLEAPGLASSLTAAVVVPTVSWALVLNDRRLAFVTLIFSLVSLPFVLRPGLRRKAALGLALLAPLVAGYVAVGWSSDAAIFQPVATLRSVTDDTDASTRSRDIEDYNLSRTAWASPVLGQGLGHPYQVVRQGDDLSQIFAQYRYLPHNSVLWLFSAGGIVGFLLVWMMLPVAVFLATRANLAAKTPVQHLLAVGAVFAVIAYAAQCYGDIGMQAWRPTLILAAFVGGAARLAADTGAWPARRHVFGRGRTPAAQPVTEGAT